MHTIVDNDKPINITLTRKDMEYVYGLAQERQDAKDLSVVRDKRIDKSVGKVKGHFIGLLGEYIVSKYIESQMNLELYPRGHDDGYDMTYAGKTIEVKTLQGSLIFGPGSLDEEFSADIAILCRFKYTDKSHRKVSPNISIQGWITRKQFEKKMFVDDLGHGLRYCVLGKDLNPMETFMKDVPNIGYLE